MDQSEQLAREYLIHAGFSSVVYEPDGNVPPDFLVDGRIAVEVRRLNQRDKNGEGLEVVEVPLRDHMLSLLRSLGPPTSGVSWFVSYSFRRPLDQWGLLSPRLKSQLESFRDAPTGAIRITVSINFDVEICPASDRHPYFFMLGAWIDDDSGGFVLAELVKNLKICLEEKTRKIAPVKHKYPEWWLVLTDRIGYGLSAFDREQFQREVRIEHEWDKVVLLDPRNHLRAFEI